jgi:hypothetical protein
MALVVASWLIVWAVASATDRVLALVAALVVAGAFTLLLAAHLVAFFVRARRAWRAGLFPVRGQPPENARTRRAFVAASTALLAGALLAPLSRLWSSEAIAQQSPPAEKCEGHPVQLNLTTPPIFGCGKAMGEKTAGLVALEDFINNLNARCAKEANCKNRLCANRTKKCLVRPHTPKDFKEGELRAPQPGECAPGDTLVFFIPKKHGKDVFTHCDCECSK